MLDILLGALSEARPAISTVIDCREVSHRDLSVIEIRYVQGDKYYAARSYATNSWIAKTPMGPIQNEDGTVRVRELEDIAEVTPYGSSVELRRRSWPSTEELIQIQKGLDLSALELVRAQYPVLNGLVHKAVFSFSPVPTIQICLAVGPRFKKFMGALAVDVHGNVTVTSKVIPEVEHYAALMRSTGLLPVAKELGYE